MNYFDPTSSDIGNTTAAERNWSVEEVAQMQTIDSAGAGAVAAEAAGVAAPAMPMQLTKRAVSGRYRGTSGTFLLELRVDVDGKRPTKRTSGDLYKVSGATVTYFGSFIVNSPTIAVTSTQVTIKGPGSFSFVTPFPIVTVTIPRVALLVPAAPAKATFADSTGGIGATYDCPLVSAYFRTVQYEQDYVAGTMPFVSYNTGLLPSGGPARLLSVVAAYAEAGIEMQPAGTSNAVPVGGAGIDALWSDAELHASMQQQFSLWKDEPQWKAWLLVATIHELGPTLRGIMFDQQGKQRQGCAVFHNVIGGGTNESQRAQLRTYVHELGHCFNLLHSWQKSFAVPPVPNRADALSWMNYVQNFPGGAAAYWAAFPFQFDDPEVVHLRHAFRDNVIMGGANFGIGAAEFDVQPFSDPVVDNSGLRLALESRKSFALSEPVVVEIKLYTTDLRGRRVHTQLHPQFGFVQLAIQKPNGQVVAYRPAMDHCVESEITVLDANRPSIYESAYVGYGKGGFYFDQVGFYQVRAIYHALDGSEVSSNVLTLRVRNPLSNADEEVADLYFGHDQGTLFYLLGSDSEFLASGNTAFDEVLDKYGQHPLAVYARMIKGINAGRLFKTITAEKKSTERQPQPDESIRLLSSVVDASEKGMGVDNITLNVTMRRLARAHKRAGDEESARKTMDRMVHFFENNQRLKPHVLRHIQAQAAEAQAETV